MRDVVPCAEQTYLHSVNRGAKKELNVDRFLQFPKMETDKWRGKGVASRRAMLAVVRT